MHYKVLFGTHEFNKMIKSHFLNICQHSAMTARCKECEQPVRPKPIRLQSIFSWFAEVKNQLVTDAWSRAYPTNTFNLFYQTEQINDYLRKNNKRALLTCSDRAVILLNRFACKK